MGKREHLIDDVQALISLAGNGLHFRKRTADGPGEEAEARELEATFNRMKHALPLVIKAAVEADKYWASNVHTMGRALEARPKRGAKERALEVFLEAVTRMGILRRTVDNSQPLRLTTSGPPCKPL